MAGAELSQNRQNMPRERMQRLGAEALADYELLALLLRTGNRGEDVVAFARRVLDESGGLVGLLNHDHERLLAIRGLGQAKIAELLAVTEIARRYVRATVESSAWSFTSPEDVRDFLLMHYKGLGYEQMGILLLDQQHKLLAYTALARGSAGQVNVPLRQLLNRVLSSHAAAVILVHNHPAHSTEPSSADRIVTQKIEHALELIEVRVLDHFIVAGNELVSMREAGGW